MGVRGLTTFVDERRRQFLHRTKFYKKCFVIDGNSLIYFLYDESLLDTRHGGEYAKFRMVVRSFFAHLQSCSISVIVILDGACDVKKRSTQLARLQNNVRCLCTMMSQETNKLLLPLLAIEAFQQILEELEILFAYSLRDADQDIVSVANQRNAFVLSNDSDFFIYPIHCGYIPLKELSWREVFSDMDGSHIYGYLYTTDGMTSVYNLKKSSLAFLPILLGCDWLDVETFACFMTRITQERKQKQTRGQRQGKNVTKNKIDCVLKWLTNHKDEFILSEIRKASSSPEITTLVDWCLKLYRNIPPSNSITRTLTEITSCKKSVTMERKVVQQPSADETTVLIESHLHELTRLGKFPSIILNMLNENLVVLLPVVVGKISLVSPHQCSYYIRNATYRLARTGAVTEYDRMHQKYCKVIISNLSKETFCNCQSVNEVSISLHRTAVNQETSRKYILEILLGCELVNKQGHTYFSNCDIHNQLLIAVTIYWVRKNEPSRNLVIALLLAIADGQINANSNFTFSSHSEKFDDGLIQQISEWQSCMKFSLILNSVLGNPLRPFQITLDCRTVASFYNHGCRFKQQAFLLKDYLKRFPRLEDTLLVLHTAIYRCINAETTTFTDETYLSYCGIH